MDISGLQSDSAIYGDALGHGEIRLIDLQPGEDEDGLAYTLSHAALDGSAYEALSYVWGPQVPSYTTTCKGCELRVGQNLFDALVYLRHATVTRRLWID